MSLHTHSGKAAYFMNAPCDEAERLLRRARADLTALRHMGDEHCFDDSIYGFHAQQAIEKALKAWLAWLERPYPFRHDIGELLAALRSAGEDIDTLWPLVSFTPYAVQLRYDHADTAEKLDRNAIVGAVADLLDQVETRILTDS